MVRGELLGEEKSDQLLWRRGREGQRACSVVSKVTSNTVVTEDKPAWKTGLKPVFGYRLLCFRCSRNPGISPHEKIHARIPVSAHDNDNQAGKNKISIKNFKNHLIKKNLNLVWKVIINFAYPEEARVVGSRRVCRQIGHTSGSGGREIPSRLGCECGEHDD